MLVLLSRDPCKTLQNQLVPKCCFPTQRVQHDHHLFLLLRSASWLPFAQREVHDRGVLPQPDGALYLNNLLAPGQEAAFRRPRATLPCSPCVGALAARTSHASGRIRGRHSAGSRTFPGPRSSPPPPKPPQPKTRQIIFFSRYRIWKPKIQNRGLGGPLAERATRQRRNARRSLP